MVWQTKAKHIVKLCRDVEDGRPKCALYYPSIAGKALYFGTIVVFTKSIQTHKVVRILFLTTKNRAKQSDIAINDPLLGVSFSFFKKK